MDILIIVLATIVSIVALILIVALFTKKDYCIEREIVINKTKQEVFNFIKFIKNQERYSKWVMADPQMRKTFKGTDGTPGFVYAWDSDDKKVGKGEQEIKKIHESERIDCELRFKKPFENTANAYMETQEVSINQTKVKWVFYGKYKYPMNIMMLILNLDNLLGNDMRVSLSNLKEVIEK